MVRKVLIALLLAASVASVSSALAGNGHGKPKPLAADQALPLTDAPGTAEAPVATPVTKAQAAAAAAQVGAVTETAAGFSSPTAALAAANACFSWSSGWNWGTWPYNQH